MSAIREWATVICMAALAASILQYLSPSGGMERMLRFVLGAFLLCGILLPFGKGLPDLEFDIQASASVSQDGQQFKDAVDRQFYEAAKNGITSVVAGDLYKMGIKCENVDLMMDTNEDNSIVINKVAVTLPAEFANRCAEAEAGLEKVLGLKTEVTAYGG